MNWAGLLLRSDDCDLACGGLVPFDYAEAARAFF
jgi:hypothetical protein